MNPTKQTADSEAYRQSLPSWGDLEGYYHPDHLGSSSWITDQDGEAIQHLQYLPFGEQYIDQRTTGWDAMFTFSGKERDQETGYGYFGARYYDSDLSIWLSVDPMASKYPSLSPYVYCANNPVKLVDPDGREIWIVGENGKRYQYKHGELLEKGIAITPRKGSFESTTLKKLNSLANSKDETITERLDDLVNSKHKHDIQSTQGENFNIATNKKGANDPNIGSGSKTYFNPNGNPAGYECVDGDFLSEATLAHELLGHGWDNDKGINNRKEFTENGIRLGEVSAINIQNIVLGENGKATRTTVGKKSDVSTQIKIPEQLLNTYFRKTTK